MTRKHFRILADALGWDLELNVDHANTITPGMVTERYGYTINSMYECNPAFDKDKFVDAIIQSAQKRQDRLNALVA
jgi:hypothetical protein